MMVPNISADESCDSCSSGLYPCYQGILVQTSFPSKGLAVYSGGALLFCRWLLML